MLSDPERRDVMLAHADCLAAMVAATLERADRPVRRYPSVEVLALRRLYDVPWPTASDIDEYRGVRSEVGPSDD